MNASEHQQIQIDMMVDIEEGVRNRRKQEEEEEGGGGGGGSALNDDDINQSSMSTTTIPSPVVTPSPPQMPSPRQEPAAYRKSPFQALNSLRRRRKITTKSHHDPHPMEVDHQNMTHNTSGDNNHNNDNTNDYYDYSPPHQAQRPIRYLRFAVLVVWLAAACCVSYGVYWHTRRSEYKEFEIEYDVNAMKILESFHATLDTRLGGINTLATALTTYAKSANRTFPFVTMPDYIVAGSNARILADAAIIHWLPLVTDSNREEWEDYAYQNRQQVDIELFKDRQFRQQEDAKLGYSTSSSPAEVGKSKSNSNNRNLASGEEDQDEAVLLSNWEEPNETTNSSNHSMANIENNVVQDGTKYHYRIWSPETKEIIPDGSCPYLPIWQRSPVSQAGQATINVDMGKARGLAGIFPYWSPSYDDKHTNTNKPRGPIFLKASIPHPNVAPLHDKNLKDSQYRHQAASYQGTPISKLAYPVFDDFGQSNFVGVLSTTVYWRLAFSNLILHNAQGIICVIENSFGQIFSYRLDHNGSNITYLGEGDPLLLNDDDDDNIIFEDMMVAYSPEQSSMMRPIEERRSYTTLSVDTEFCEYKLKIFPTKDTYEIYQKKEPMTYTVIVASIFGLAAILFLMYDYSVQRLQKAFLAKGLEQANHAAIAERELNEYLSHEVRNPIAAAISACSFVNAAVNEETPLSTAVSRQAVREDVHIIKSSLQFTNDLLRNMLDLHRAVHHRVSITKKEVSLYHDVLEPVASMLYCRDDNFKLILECPKHLIVETDNLRLKQIVLNLGRNAAKFVEIGFVRLRAEVVNTKNDDEEVLSWPVSKSTVRIYVEDSGPGIPIEKRKALFSKYQQSLDLLNQGTGVGLCLCEKLIDILGGELWLDESYNSGIDSCPGSCFVIDLKTEPVEFGPEEESISFQLPARREVRVDGELMVKQYDCCHSAESGPRMADSHQHPPTCKLKTIQQNNNMVEDATTISETQGSLGEYSTGSTESPDFAFGGVSTTTTRGTYLPGDDEADGKEKGLPEFMSVLFVDDDMILRKLFSRSIKKHFPGWKVREASSGETAIRLVDSETFDVIFIDQYMASTEKQLLGTETTRELRSKGVKSKICGLSANFLEEAFSNAGADGFMLKPVPCDKEELGHELRRLLFTN